MEDCDDDWENVVIPDLIKREKERRMLEERKMIEDADKILTEELFLGETNVKMENNNTLIIPIHVQKKEKIIGSENRRQKDRRQMMVKNQKEEAEKIRKKKAEKKRTAEIYGDAELDEYYEKYGYIEG